MVKRRSHLGKLSQKRRTPKRLRQNENIDQSQQLIDDLSHSQSLRESEQDSNITNEVSLNSDQNQNRVSQQLRHGFRLSHEYRNDEHVINIPTEDNTNNGAHIDGDREVGVRREP